MPYVLTPGVEREILRTFGPDDVEHVRSRLVEQELPWDEFAPPPRVHIAVIWLSKGDRKRFDGALEGACYDWRDTLMEAGLANADWPDTLRRRDVDLDGIDITGVG